MNQRTVTRSTRSAPAPGAETPTHNQRLGARGEAIAHEHLEDRGCIVLARNWRTREGELDLIVRDGDTVVAVEVKTRSSLDYGHPLEAITARKAHRLRRLLGAWAREHAARGTRLRVDAIGVVLRGRDRPRIEHLQGIA